MTSDDVIVSGNDAIVSVDDVIVHPHKAGEENDGGWFQMVVDEC